MAKFLTFFAGAILGFSLLRAESDPAQLSGYPIERYKAILDKSPFAKETPVEESPVGPLFGQDLVLTGHFKLGEVLYAVILNKKTQERLTASSEETRADRPKVVSFVIDADPGKSSAVIQLGVEKTTLQFEKIQAPKESQKIGGPAPQTPAASASTSVPANPPPQKPLERVRYKNLKPK